MQGKAYSATGGHEHRLPFVAYSPQVYQLSRHPVFIPWTSQTICRASVSHTAIRRAIAVIILRLGQEER